MTSEGAGTFHSLWKGAGFPAAGATPASGDGAIPTKATTGALPFSNPTAPRKLWFSLLAGRGGTIGSVTIYDRLWHNSGLVGNIITDQTFTQPALTRYVDGEGVELWGEVYTAMGATGSVFTATYVNQDGTGTRSATYTMPANALAVGQMFRFEYQDGDYGIRSVSKVALSISTGTAGDFGLVLMKPIGTLSLVTASVRYLADAIQLGMQEIVSDACLALQVDCSTTNTGAMVLEVLIGEN